MFRNILVPTDGSARSRRAAAIAVRLAKEQGARVTALWVGPAWEPNLYAYERDVPPGYVAPHEHAAHVKRMSSRFLAPVLRSAVKAGVKCEGVAVQGVFPHDEIIKATRRTGCDLIVMGSHGRRGVSLLLLGSVTSKVVALATVPVLVCR